MVVCFQYRVLSTSSKSDFDKIDFAKDFNEIIKKYYGMVMIYPVCAWRIKNELEKLPEKIEQKLGNDYF